MEIIGKRFILKPDEGFQDLMRNLPRKGTITDQLESIDGNKDWYIFHFDKPFDYKKEFNNPQRCKHISVSEVLVRSRWHGYPIGGEETATFILIPPKGVVFKKQFVDVKGFYFDGRGMIEKEPNQGMDLTR